MINNLEKKFNPEVIAKATEAMVQRVYFNNPQPLNTFLDNLELQHPKELENITTPLNRLGFSWEDFDVSEKSWIQFKVTVFRWEHSSFTIYSIYRHS